jgi:hypothetical protein
MRPAEREGDLISSSQSAIAAVAVHLQHAGKARQMRDRRKR